MTFKRLPQLGDFPYAMHPGEGPHARALARLQRAEAVTGACMVLRRDLAQELGGFDEDYVIGDFEDADLCFRIRARGLDCAVHEDAVLWHLERQSQGTPGEFLAAQPDPGQWLDLRAALGAPVSCGRAGRRCGAAPRMKPHLPHSLKEGTAMIRAALRSRSKRREKALPPEIRLLPAPQRAPLRVLVMSHMDPRGLPRRGRDRRLPTIRISEGAAGPDHLVPRRGAGQDRRTPGRAADPTLRAGRLRLYRAWLRPLHPFQRGCRIPA